MRTNLRRGIVDVDHARDAVRTPTGDVVDNVDQQEGPDGNKRRTQFTRLIISPSSTGAQRVVTPRSGR